VTIRRTLVSLAAAACVLAGCTDRSSTPLAPPADAAHVLSVDLTGLLQFIGTPNLTAPRHAEKLISASTGGFVELQGFRVDIPAGALSSDAVITIDLPSDPVLAKRVMADFGPHGLQFNQPVTLSFPLTNVLVGGPVQVSRWENDHWVGLGGWLSDGGTRLNGTTPHFSRYGGTTIMAGG
jgi:hypothetical protein